MCIYVWNKILSLPWENKKGISRNQKPHYNPLPSPLPFLRGYILGFHSQHPPYHLPTSFYTEKSRRHLSQQRWAGFTVGSDSLPMPQSTPAPGKRNGRGPLLKEGREHLPPQVDNGLGCGLADLLLCLPELEMVAERQYPEKLLVSSFLARIHSRGLPSGKGTRQLEVVWSAAQGRAERWRGGLTDRSDLLDQGTMWSLLPDPFPLQQAGGS